MKREDVHVGMRVIFGQPDGERTLGKIVKLSATRAKVISLEPRRDRQAGSLWNVPYFLLESTAVSTDFGAFET